jgi:sporulation protein YlmC with PRC-barrel domain
VQPTAGWQASRLIHRPVVHARLVARAGEVVDVVFSAEGRQVVGLLVGSAGAESGLLELLRRLLGGDFGLTFVPVERVLALAGDVVMVDTDAAHGGELLRALMPIPIRHLPRLRTSSDFAVLTMQGQRLGRFADLLLDATGRRIMGYVVMPDPLAPVPPVAPAPPNTVPAPHVQGVSVAAPPPPSVAAQQPVPAAQPFVIPARFRVRFGRGIVVVGEDVSRPVVPSVPAGQSAPWPAPRWADESQLEPPDVPPSGYPTEQPFAPDAPTEQVPPQV